MTTTDTVIVNDRFGLKQHTISAIRNVFALHPEIEQAVLYGSRAKGTYRPGSDIDLTLFGEALTYAQLNRIETEIDDLLLPYTVDLSLYTGFLERHIGAVCRETSSPAPCKNRSQDLRLC